jgi:hypothetical protein
LKRYRNSWQAIKDSLWPSKGFRANLRHYRGDGFEIRYVSTWDLEYVEGDHRLKIGKGIGKGSDKWYDTWEILELRGPLRWEAPHELEAISEEKAKQIKLNLAQYYEAVGIPYDDE